MRLRGAKTSRESALEPAKTLCTESAKGGSWFLPQSITQRQFVPPVHIIESHLGRLKTAASRRLFGGLSPEASYPPPGETRTCSWPGRCLILQSDDMNGTDSRPTRDVKYVQSFLGSTLLASWGNRGNVAQYNREWRECLRSDARLVQTTGDFPFTSKFPLKLRYR